MKKTILSLLFAVGLNFIFFTHVDAAELLHLQNPDFIYSYNTVYDSNSSQYIISETNIQKYDESPNGASMWTPLAFAQPALIIQKFTFDNITTSIALNFNIVGGGGVNTGTAKMEASADGINWDTLLQVSGASGSGAVQYYNSLLPTNFIGTSALWLRTSLETTGTGYWDPKFAQFSRGLSPSLNPTSPVFLLEATVIPEPSTYALFGIGAIGMLIVIMKRKKTA